MREIKKIVIHCSDSDNMQHDNLETIKKWHVEERGWKEVGYHFVITKSEGIKKARRIDIQGAHVKGHNEDSIGICLTGKHIFTLKQLILCNQLIKDLKNIYKDVDCYKHCDLDDKKTCPNLTQDEYSFILK